MVSKKTISPKERPNQAAIGGMAARVAVPVPIPAPVLAKKKRSADQIDNVTPGLSTKKTSAATGAKKPRPIPKKDLETKLKKASLVELQDVIRQIAAEVPDGIREAWSNFKPVGRK
jgi:hypothetical protein